LWRGRWSAEVNTHGRVVAPGLGVGRGPASIAPMRRTATAVILLAMLAVACEPSLERSQATRSPAGANADARHVVVDTDLAFDDIMACSTSSNGTTS
jgi:hypothetical protein